MKFKILKTDEEYNEAIDFLECLGDVEDFQDQPELIDQFELLSTLINFYEKKNFPINAGDPIEIIKLKMSYMGLKRKDLIPLIGSSGVVSDIFNKKRGLSKNMIRALSELLDIDQQILNLEYQLSPKSSLDLQFPVKKETPICCFDFIKSKQQNIRRFKNQLRENRMLFNINTYCAV